MPSPHRPLSRAWWLLLVPAAAGLVLLAARGIAERRAEEAAMSAELLTPFAPGGDSAVADGPDPVPDPVAATPGAESAIGDSSPTPGPAADGGLAALVPPELAGALAPDTLPPAPPEPPPLDPALFSDWTTYEDAVARSRATGRPVLLAFTAVGCETCESLRAAVFDDEAANVTLRSAVIPVAVHDTFADTGAEARLVDDLQQRFGVTTFPTLVVWSPVTKRLRALKGFRGTAATLRFITDSASAVD